jgi:tetratricopeptide (TPR) repeat protein
MRARTPWLPMLALLLSLVLPGAAFAQTADDREPVDMEKLRKSRKARAAKYPVGSRVSRYLAAAAEASDEGNPEEGMALLDKLNMKRINPYERALIYRLKAYVAYAAGGYEVTIESFENVLAEEVMSVEADNRIRFNIAQLYATLQQWREVITALERWFRYVEDPNPLAYYLLGISHYQLEEVDLAIANTEKAVDLSEEPPEGWLQLLAALYIQQEDYASATPILEELVMRFPKKQYWVQLSLIYGARDDYRHSLAVQQVAYLQGLLTEDKELRRLARSYLYHDLPYPAARVLEKGIEEGAIESDAKAYELLANSWIAAREYDRSLAPLRRAAELSDDGKLFIRLGQVHLQREEWGEAAERLREALKKGGLEKPGNAQLLLGIAYYNDQRVGPARSAFVRARQYTATRAEADRWITHIERERTGGAEAPGLGEDHAQNT